MRLSILLLGIMGVGFPTLPTWAQPPAQLPPLSASPLSPAPVPAGGTRRFDPTALQVKAENGRWQLWAGNQLLKEFGPAEREAQEALRVLRDLRVDSHGSVGAAFEYWLAEGQAPSALTRHKMVIPFDSRTLRVEQLGGQWVLRDARMILFGFGRSQTDAEQALGVCRQYGFDQLGFIGHPTPSLKYLMKDPAPRSPMPTVASLTPTSVSMLPAEIAHPRLVLPGAGDVGELLPFDGRRLDLRRESGEWVMYNGRTPVAHFGPAERDARSALEALQQFRVTDVCQVGDSGFRFFLCNGRAPTGTVVGMSAKRLQTEALNVRQLGGAWAVCEGSHVLFNFGDRSDDARHLLAAIKAYHFDHVASLGRSFGNSYLFVRTGN